MEKTAMQEMIEALNLLPIRMTEPVRAKAIKDARNIAEKLLEKEKYQIKEAYGFGNSDGQFHASRTFKNDEEYFNKIYNK